MASLIAFVSILLVWNAAVHVVSQCLQVLVASPLFSQLERRESRFVHEQFFLFVRLSCERDKSYESNKMHLDDTL
jgi:hypothetical protein